MEKYFTLGQKVRIRRDTDPFLKDFFGPEVYDVISGDGMSGYKLIITKMNKDGTVRGCLPAVNTYFESFIALKYEDSDKLI